MESIMEQKNMAYSAKDYLHLIGTPGFSKESLKNHLLLYQGYVSNTNKVLDALSFMLRDGNTARAEFSELKRRLGWEFDGMRLHEYYFENIGETSSFSRDGSLAGKMIQEFGSTDEWEKDFKATGLLRGIGWAVLYHDSAMDRLFNSWINEHDVSHPTGCVPLLIMDVFEHAYMHDYGLKRADYIEAFFQSINWPVVESRFRGEALSGGK
jgi:Fe-Mn family superoxide dismutase